MVQNLLTDPASGAAARRELLAYEEQALASAGLAAERQCEVLIDLARRAGKAAERQALTEPKMVSLSLWLEKLKRLLACVRTLIARGHNLKGPVLAWKALKEGCLSVNL